MKLYSTSTGTGKRPRRRIGEPKKEAIKDLLSFPKMEQTQLLISVKINMLKYERGLERY